MNRYERHLVIGKVSVKIAEKTSSYISLRFNSRFPGGPGLASARMSPFWISMKQDDGDGGDNWSCKTCKAPAKLSPPTNQ